MEGKGWRVGGVEGGWRGGGVEGRRGEGEGAEGGGDEREDRETMDHCQKGKTQWNGQTVSGSNMMTVNKVDC